MRLMLEAAGIKKMYLFCRYVAAGSDLFTASHLEESGLESHFISRAGGRYFEGHAAFAALSLL